MAHLLIAATHKSSGKTVIAAGLAAALGVRGLRVQTFKKGPDYIDPMWLAAASGRSCHSLDFHTMAADEIGAEFARRGASAEVCLIEGNKGLHDGVDVLGQDSNAALAALLGSPVVLVIDTRGMTRGVAPLILGQRDFDPRVRLAGVILNRVGGDRHAAKLRAAIEHYTDLPVLGALHTLPALEIAERHLGLVPGNEHPDVERQIAAMGAAVATAVDLEHLLAVARTAAPAAAPPGEGAPVPSPDVTIGIARDAAFGFYYPGDLEALGAAGARLVPVDTINDAGLPALDGLFIGGGFPETHLAELARNDRMRRDIAAAIDAGLPVYAECGGLMYLTRTLHWHGRTAAMVGAIPADTVMHARPAGRGYVRLRETGALPWPPATTPAPCAEIPAHEFHHSSLTGLGEDTVFAYEVLRGTGIDGAHDGIVHRNVVGCYSHQRDTPANRWAARFVAFVRDCTRGRR